jgi:hypothetical protein
VLGVNPKNPAVRVAVPDRRLPKPCIDLVHEHAQTDRLSHLVAGIEATARLAGGKEYFLGCRQAATLVGITGNNAHQTAWRWLSELTRHGYLDRTHQGQPGPGGKPNTASRWKWLGPMKSEHRS